MQHQNEDSTSVQIDGYEALKDLADHGARFALPRGRTKGRFPSGWQNNPKTYEEAVAHASAGGNVGLMCGKHSNNLVVVDIDVNFMAVLPQLDELAKTTRIIRDNAPDRGKLIYRYAGASLPQSGAGKPKGADGNHIEFLSTGRHAITEPSMYDGGRYLLEGTEHGIRDLSGDDLDRIWHLITGDPFPAAKKAPRTASERSNGQNAGDVPEYASAAPTMPVTRYSPSVDPLKEAYKQKVRGSWTPLEVFQYHGWVRQQPRVESNGDLRIPDHDGLLITENSWYHHSNVVGGDVINAWYYCQTDGQNAHPKGAEFWRVVNAMGDIKGISDPTKTVDRGGSDNAYLLTEGFHDTGQARCVVRRHAGKFTYSESLGWMYFDGTKWARTGAGAALDRAVVETLESRIRAALDSGEVDKHKDLLSKCVPSRSRKAGAIDLMQHMVYTDVSEFDAFPDDLNCPNGVVDLRTGELSPHSNDKKFTFCTAVDYNPAADQSTWVEWLNETTQDPEMTDWLQMAVGYSFTGHTSEEVLFYLFGPTRSGKGTYTETLLKLLGRPVSTEVDFGVLTAKRDADAQNFALAPLKPCRFVAAGESSEYERFNEAKLKAITGGNEIYCAFKHQDHFAYRPQFKIWLNSNQPINANPDDSAVWTRLRVIEFPNSHEDNEDKSLKHRLKSPEVLEGVLAWAVEGARRWYALGRTGLPELASSAAKKKDQRDALDTMTMWLEEKTTFGLAPEDQLSPDKYYMTTRQLYGNYKIWCDSNGVESKKQRAWIKAMIARGFERKKLRLIIDGENTQRWCFVGVNLLPNLLKGGPRIRLKKE